MSSRELEPYVTAFTDWLACAVGGRYQPASLHAYSVADGIEGRVAATATAGHVLDYDDTFLPGIAHLSAPTAPVALVLGAEQGVDVGTMVASYAQGFEVMGAMARAAHPALYDAGIHPTALCGAMGAAVVASRLLGLDDEQEARAGRLAMLGATGLLAAFGSDAKSLQVGVAAASGVRAARLAESGATASDGILAAIQEIYGFALVGSETPAILENWTKNYPCCLQTHSSIEAAAELKGQGASPGDEVTAVVHPVSRRAASYDDVEDGLQAKFSIPYIIAFTLRHGPPGVGDFTRLNEEVRIASKAVRVVTDPSLLESEAVLTGPGDVSARVEAATGSPQNPLDAQALSKKIHYLAGDRLDGLFEDASDAASGVYEASGLR